MSNLLYQCKNCKHEWGDLLEKCPKCGHDEFIVIDRPKKNTSYLKYIIGLSILVVLGVGYKICYDSEIVPPPPPDKDELQLVNEASNEGYLEFNKTLDEIVFTSANGDELYVEDNKVYPCKMDKGSRITWKSNVDAKISGDYFLQENFSKSTKGCVVQSTFSVEGIKSSDNSWEFSLRLRSSQACGNCVAEFSLDNISWSTKNTFTCDELELASKVYGRHVCQSCSNSTYEAFVCGEYVECPEEIDLEKISSQLSDAIQQLAVIDRESDKNKHREKIKEIKSILRELENDMMLIRVKHPNSIIKDANSLVGRLRQGEEKQYSQVECQEDDDGFTLIVQ